MSQAIVINTALLPISVLLYSLTVLQLISAWLKHFSITWLDWLSRSLNCTEK